MSHIEDILDKLQKVKPSGKGYTALCPAHSDKNASLSITKDRNGKILLYCHAGCEFSEIVDALGLKESDLFPPKPEDDESKFHYVGKPYQYTDENGTVLYEVLRKEDGKGNKRFLQRQPNGQGGWIWNMDGIQRVPYHLPFIIKSVVAGSPVFIVEGEKDAMTLRNHQIVATCNAGGAGKWLSSYAKWFKGARVILLPDNDITGCEHMMDVAKSLNGVATSIHYVQLPNLAPKGDVTDWLKTHTKEELLKTVQQTAKEWTADTTIEPSEEAKKLGKEKPKSRKKYNSKQDKQSKSKKDAPQVPYDDSLPEIIVSNRQLRDITAESIEALAAGNKPEVLFVRSGSLVRLRPTDAIDGLSAIVDNVTIDIIRNRMSQTANYIKYTKTGEAISVPPPLDNAKDVLAVGQWPFPPLDAIVATPVVRADGTILTQPGYDRATRLYFKPEDGFAIPAIPEKPTAKQIESAKTIIHDILADFPFVSEADYANAIAMMLTPICRSAISGCIPLAIVNAPQPGSGKGLLTRVINLVTTGREPAMMTAPDNREEWRKTITTQLMQGNTLIVIDNVEHKLFDASLASVLTVACWTDRLLGTNKSVSIPNRACFTVTGNNVKLGGDLPRRCYWISINPQTSRPELRSGFRHSNLPDYVKRERAKIVTALLTLVKSWFVNDCQLPNTPILGSYEEWSRVIGGIMENAGIKGFLDNAEECRKEASEDDNEWEIFFNAINDIWEDNLFTTQDIDAQICFDNVFANALPEFLTDIRNNPKVSFARKLGNIFSKISGKCFGKNNIQIVKTACKNHNKTHWQVITNTISRSNVSLLVMPPATPCRKTEILENIEENTEKIENNFYIEGVGALTNKTNKLTQPENDDNVEVF